VIVFEDVGTRYGDRVAGEGIFLVGASGSGKTTTLKMVNRLIEPSAGRILLDGRDAREGPAHRLRRRVGYAFQGAGLFPHLTVGENVAVTPELLGWPRRRIGARVDALLEMVELAPADYRDRWPQELSGGQQQRVGLARALAAEPEVLLLDEPFAALDPLTRDRLQQSFRGLRRALDVTVLFVSHDMAEALLLADRIAVMEGGRLLQVGTPRELVSAPADATVAELLATPLRQREAVEALLGAVP
jgi:osmoprotectant transport system ATP-binding protein